MADTSSTSVIHNAQYWWFLWNNTIKIEKFSIISFRSTIIFLLYYIISLISFS